MIESLAVKKFIIIYFLENSTMPIVKIIREILIYLNTHFVIDEIVEFVNEKFNARIKDFYNNEYSVVAYTKCYKKMEGLSTKNLRRIEALNEGSIIGFLEDITKVSPFGIILKENILKEITEALEKQKANEANIEKTIITRIKKDPGNYSESITNGYPTIISGNKEYFIKDSFMVNSSKKIKNANFRDVVLIKNQTDNIQKKPRYQEQSIRVNLSNDRLKRDQVRLDNKITKTSNILHILESLDVKKIEIVGISDLKLFLEVYFFFDYFKNYSEISFSKENFASAVLDQEYNTEIIFKIHRFLLEILSEEFNSSTKTKYKRIIETSAKICIEDDAVTQKLPKYSKYDWMKVKINEKNWKSVMNNLLSYIFHKLDIARIGFYKDCISRIDNLVSSRLGILKFLIECSLHTEKLKSVANTQKNNEKEIEHIISKAKTFEKKHSSKRGRKSKRKPLIEEDWLFLSKHTTKSCYLDGIYFFYFDEGIFFLKQDILYEISLEKAENFLKSYTPPIKNQNCILRMLESYLHRSSKLMPG